MASNLELVKKNAVEIISEQELSELLSSDKEKIAYCGYEPSGPVHLGHMVTISKLVDLEKAGFKIVVLLADLHAWLNKKGSKEFIEEQCKEWEASFKKLGLKNAKFVRGSSFQLKPQYVEDVFQLAQHITINRGVRSMQEVARDIEHASLSQAIYPLMQVCDMKHLNISLAVGGLEQRKIHGLAREELSKINFKAPVLVHTPLISSLIGPMKLIASNEPIDEKVLPLGVGKMSSSNPESMISVKDNAEAIKKKISKAYCPEGSLEGNPVLQIVKLIVFSHVKEFKVERPEKFGGNVSYDSFALLEKDFVEKKLHPMDLKNALAKYLIEILGQK